MTRIAVIGATGYAGSSIAQEAARRGHEVGALSRSPAKEPIEGVRYVQGAAADAAAGLIADADVVVAALSPRGDTAGTLVQTYTELAQTAAAAGARLVVVGGFSSLRPAPGAPRFALDDGIPTEYLPEITEMDAVREALSTTPVDVDWLFVSPAANYGSEAPGDALGTYRTSDEIALFDEHGESAISGPDFALAIVDEIENPKHQRTHIGFAY